jgi:hypothetical protein
MQIVMIPVDSNRDEVNADLALRRTKCVRPEEQEHEQNCPKPGLRPQEPIPQ